MLIVRLHYDGPVTIVKCMAFHISSFSTIPQTFIEVLVSWDFTSFAISLYLNPIYSKKDIRSQFYLSMSLYRRTANNKAWGFLKVGKI